MAGNVTFVEGTANGNDDNGHGTLVAGIVAALDNDIGVIGVAPEASLYAVKVLNSSANGYISDIIAGLQWSIDNGMHILNMSFGGGTRLPDTMLDVMEAAYRAGIVLVGGAGNSGNPDGSGDNVIAPARYDMVIAVGATDETNARLSSSSTGYPLEIMAPGNNIYSTALGGGYGYLGQTSAASPHVAGAAALLRASGITNNTAIRKRLGNSSPDLDQPGWDTKTGNGLTNIKMAIDFTEPPDQSFPSTTLTLSGTLGDFRWWRTNVQVTLSATDSGGSSVATTMYSLNSGNTWYNYTSPLSITTQGYNYVLARSWDTAGNDEGPPPFKEIRIDKTLPTQQMTINPTTIIGQQKRNQLVEIAYNGSADDRVGLSGLNTWNVQLIDEYGDYTRNLGTSWSGYVMVEAWAHPSDTDGRKYTIRFTAWDFAGNTAILDNVATVFRQ